MPVVARQNVSCRGRELTRFSTLSTDLCAHCSKWQETTLVAAIFIFLYYIMYLYIMNLIYKSCLFTWCAQETRRGSTAIRSSQARRCSPIAGKPLPGTTAKATRMTSGPPTTRQAFVAENGPAGSSVSSHLSPITNSRHGGARLPSIKSNSCAIAFRPTLESIALRLQILALLNNSSLLSFVIVEFCLTRPRRFPGLALQLAVIP